MEFDVYTLMYVGFAVLGLALAYVVAGQKLQHLMRLGRKTSQADPAAAA
jgi:hypothetical protein